MQALARRKPDNPELMPLVKPPQNYIEVEAALPSAVNFGPAERARMVKASTDICEKKGVLGAGYIPKFDWVDASANSEGLFTYFHYADASFILTCRTPGSDRIGMGGHDRREGHQEHRRGDADQRGGRQGAASRASRARSSPATTR